VTISTNITRIHPPDSKLRVSPESSPAQPKPKWLIPAGLIALSLIPVVAGAARMIELSSNATLTPDNARFFSVPLPVIVHIPSATIFSLLGAMQFAPTLRRRPWHRRTGRLVVPAGLAAAISGLWMAVYYHLPALDNGLLKVFRVIAGFGMVTSLLLGCQAIRTRRFSAHRAWMMRGYAIGLGAGTQVLTHLLWFVVVGEPTANSRALLMGAGWAINVAVAEWFIHARSQLKGSQASPVPEPGRTERRP
jgi:Predicted membrane protein (DUF2306)